MRLKSQNSFPIFAGSHRVSAVPSVRNRRMQVEVALRCLPPTIISWRFRRTQFVRAKSRRISSTSCPERT